MLSKTFKKNYKLSQPITISTPYGKFLIIRNVDYCSYCRKIFGQYDKILEIDKNHRATKDFIERITYVSQIIPGFTNAKELLLKLNGIEISSSQLQKISEEIGKKVYEQQKNKADYAYKKPEKAIPTVLEKDKKDTILYILMDGSAVNTRIEDPNGSTWKEMKLGMTFLDSNVIKRKDESCTITKKEYVAYMGNVEEFKKMLFKSAIDSGYGKVKKVVVIGDGAHWIWNLCEEIFPDAECILDFFHMKENVYNYAKAIYPNDEKKYKKWAETTSYYIKTEQFKKALKKIRNSPTPTGNNVSNLAGYLENNKNRIAYLHYKNKGYYIGSGMIESGNKTVVQKRLKQAGMRWGISGAQYMVTLRAKYESNKWGDVVDAIFQNAA